MSDDDKGFLARWSQRKREAGKPEPNNAATEAPARQPAEPPKTAAEAEPPFDLESLPKLEELTKDTDMTVFFKSGVPESVRNAALRKSWALDPAIRNYVNPALDYAYDWNTPGGVPGTGELAPGTDIARMVAQVFGEPTEAVEKTAPAAEDATPQMRQADAPTPPIRLTEAAPTIPADAGSCAEAEAAPQQTSGAADDADGERRAFASQQEPRKHGSARPK
jgi:hypothetical protein